MSSSQSAHSGGTLAHDVRYQFGTAGPGSCPTGTVSAAAAGANTNRTLMTDSWTDPTLPAGSTPVTTTTGSCYDATDRLLTTSSTTSAGSPPPATSASYDSHGNTLTLGGQRLTFDADDRNTGLSDATGTSFENGNTALGLLQALAAIGVLVGFLFTVYKWQFSPGRGRHARRRRR